MITPTAKSKHLSPAKMTCIEKLPTELVRTILRKLQQISRVFHDNDFIYSFQVCSWWRDLGQELLWTDVQLEDEEILNFIEKAPKVLSPILSLTVSIDPRIYEEQAFEHTSRPDAQAPASRTLSLWNTLRLLPARLAEMPMLETFSFKIREHTRRGPTDGFFLQQRNIHDILVSLPQSIVNLEIDTWCLDRSETLSKDWHICETLASRLARFSSVRLRLSNFCKQLLNTSSEGAATDRIPTATKGTSVEGKTSTASTELIINTIGHEMISLTRECGGPFPLFIDPWDASLHCKTLTRQLLCQAGSMKLSVIDTTEPGLTNPGRRIFSVISKRSNDPAIAIRTPFFEIGFNDGHYCLRRKDGQGADFDVCCNLGDVTDTVEGSIWVETIEGYRYPRQYFERGRRFRHALLKPSSTWNKEEFQAKKRKTAQLWQMEEREGRCLLHQEESGDLDDVTGITRDMTKGEARRLQKQLGGSQTN